MWVKAVALPRDSVSAGAEGECSTWRGQLGVVNCVQQ